MPKKPVKNKPSQQNSNVKPLPPENKREGALFRALARFDAEFPGVDKRRINPFTNSLYASLDDIMHVAKPYLRQNELIATYISSLQNNPSNGDVFPVLTLKILHLPSNEVLESTLPLPGVDVGGQQIGGYMTYWRRYLFAGVFNIVETDDDDGNALQKPEAVTRLTEKQHSELLALVEVTNTKIGDADTENTLLHHISEAMNLTEIDQLSSRQASVIIKMLKTKEKNQRKEAKISKDTTPEAQT